LFNSKFRDIILLMSDKSKKKILDYLVLNRFGSAGEISSSIGLTKAAVQYHLKTMCQSGIVNEIQTMKPLCRRGHPTILYFLNQKSSLSNLENLSNAVINLYLSSRENNKEALQNIATHMYTIPAILPVALPQRINAVIAFLNENNYCARWEAHKNGPQIRFSNCPFSSLVNQNRFLCEIDRLILEFIFECPVTRIMNNKKDSIYVEDCAFLILKGL
jgi:predicted ArsR family transcriptional regulator